MPPKLVDHNLSFPVASRKNLLEMRFVASRKNLLESCSIFTSKNTPQNLSDFSSSSLFFIIKNELKIGLLFYHHFSSSK